MAISGAGSASALQAAPVQLEFFLADRVSTSTSAYQEVVRNSRGFVGRAVLWNKRVRFEVEDQWTVARRELHLSRAVRVRGDGEGGFLSGVTFEFTRPTGWTDAQWFAPGVLYGGFANLSANAIGGRAYYRPGGYTVRIREDRLPAPLILAHFDDGSSLAVLNPAPRGGTTTADANDVLSVPLVDERFQFGAIGGLERDGTLAVGYWFPGSEGEVTYAGNTYPGGQLHQLRPRYHPIRDGLTQRYEVLFQLGHQERFVDAYPRAWRRAWEALRPEPASVDLTSARRAIVDVLAHNVIEKEGRAGIPNYLDVLVKSTPPEGQNMVLGFTGKNLEAAQFLLREAEMDTGSRGLKLRGMAETMITSFLSLKVAPPEGEGFHLGTGRPVCALGRPEVYLRSFGDDLKALLKAYQREKRSGREHGDWLAWCRAFGDWLLTQEQKGGGFPRSWMPGTGEVIAASPNSSYNAVSLLVLLSKATGDTRYLNAAVRAADFCWSNGQSQGRFVGGTIDNPDVLDKEAATLSLEAYLHLHEATGDPKWLPRAVAAAQFAETWIYCWNVPMPADDDDSHRHWKQGVSTVGLQLISTGHSLVDAYMAFDVDEYARLAKLTGDRHYLDVACLLLHNTKSMLALPGRTFDLGEPGWQQEHWSLAPRRGYGLHRGWLPWVATSQLNGIFGLMDLDPDLYRRLAGKSLSVREKR